MDTQVPKKRYRRRDAPVLNPYHDTLSQEIGYKLDSRYAGCLLFSFATGLLMMFGFAFLVYWFMH